MVAGMFEVGAGTLDEPEGQCQLDDNPCGCWTELVDGDVGRAAPLRRVCLVDEFDGQLAGPAGGVGFLKRQFDTLAGALAKPLFGVLSDQFDKRGVVTASLACQIVGVIGIIAADGFWGLAVSGCLFGLGYGV